MGEKIALALIEALPYLPIFAKKVLVIKFGGAILTDSSILRSLAEDIALLHYLGIKIVVIHGGGPQISDVANKFGLNVEFSEKGLRKTDSKMMEIIEMVLQGKINKELSCLFSSCGVKSVGISGVDNFMFSVKPAAGRVGEIKRVNTSLIDSLLDASFLPIVAPLGINEEDSLTYNINADHVAGALAAAIPAFRLIILTDVDGIFSSIDDQQRKLLSSLSKRELEDLIKSGDIRGGMIPKAEAALHALNSKVEKVHIINGKIPHSLILELFTDKGIGTQIIP